jgi:hypothetical protein
MRKVLPSIDAGRLGNNRPKRLSALKGRDISAQGIVLWNRPNDERKTINE